MLAELDQAQAILVPLQDLPLSAGNRAEVERQLRNNAKVRELVEKLQKIWA